MEAHDPHSLRDSWTGPWLGSQAPTHPVRTSCASLDSSLNAGAGSAGLEKHHLWPTEWHNRPEIPAHGAKLPALGPNPTRRWEDAAVAAPHARALAVTVTLGQALKPRWPSGGVQTPRPAPAPSRPSTEQTGQSSVSPASQSTPQFSTTHTAYQVPSQERLGEQTTLQTLFL